MPRGVTFGKTCPDCGESLIPKSWTRCTFCQMKRKHSGIFGSPKRKAFPQGPLKRKTKRQQPTIKQLLKGTVLNGYLEAARVKQFAKPRKRKRK